MYVCMYVCRARCTLNKEIFDLLNEESISGAHSGRHTVVYKFDEKSTTTVQFKLAL